MNNSGKDNSRGIINSLFNICIKNISSDKLEKELIKEMKLINN